MTPEQREILENQYAALQDTYSKALEDPARSPDFDTELQHDISLLISGVRQVRECASINDALDFIHDEFDTISNSGLYNAIENYAASLEDNAPGNNDVSPCMVPSV